MNNFKDLRWKWLEEKGLKVYGDQLQVDYLKALWEPVDKTQGVFCEAKAGTGKTALAVLAGAYEVENQNYDKIIYIRNAVPVRDQGFLPGDDKQKSEPYMVPVADALNLLGYGTYESWASEFSGEPRLVTLTTAFVRGVTWENTFVIIDEAQNFDLEELQATYTRCSKTSKVVTIGSVRQVDNRKVKRIAGLTPFEVFMKHFEGMEGVSFHTLENCYRGWFADHADDIQETVKKLGRVV